jgi:hypothetical protein
VSSTLDKEIRAQQAQLQADQADLVVRKLKRSRNNRFAYASDQVTSAAAQGRSKLSDSEFRQFRSAVLDATTYDQALKVARKVRRQNRSAAKIKVKSEPRVYGKRSGHSYFFDLATVSSPLEGRGVDEYLAAKARMDRHQREVAAEVRRGSREGKRALRLVGEELRGQSPIDIQSRRSELRAGTSSTIAGFTTPAYLVDQWVAFKSPYRAVADQVGTVDLPAYGLQLNIPSFTAGATEAQQSEGTALSNALPTGAGLQTNLVTIGGQVVISQQLEDRGGAPGTSMDSIIAAALKESYDQNVDAYVISQILTGASVNTITDATAVTVPLLYGDIASAKEAIVNAAGAKLPATHMFAGSGLVGWMGKQLGTNNLPLFQPTWTAQPFAQLASEGSFKSRAWTGHEIQGLALFQDLNIPNSGSNLQTLVGRPDQVHLAEGDWLVRAYFETLANQLQVVVQAYAYVGAIVKRSQSFAIITGAGYPSTLA